MAVQREAQRWQGEAEGDACTLPLNRQLLSIRLFCSHNVVAPVLFSHTTCPTRVNSRVCASSEAAAAATAPAADVAVNAGTSSSGNSAAGAPPAELLLHNTMTRSKELFFPRAGQGNSVSMYVCGVTVYDYSHVGE